MEMILYLIDFVLHLNVHLGELIRNYGTWTYLILFLIIFCETGLVVTPILPGDSLLFAAGAIAATGVMDVYFLFLILSIAAIAGDTVNYSIGKAFGPRVFKENVRFLKKEYLDRTHAFYEKHGGKTIIIARFMPIIRTFAPFVAGVGTMSYKRFISFNVVGGVLWIFLFLFTGFLFGNIKAVQENFSFIIVAIVIISVMPAVIEFIKSRRKNSSN
jgi:membrane-associated protein